jgi:GAF domain-containing protein
VLGALTVQSSQPAAFNQDTVTILEIMADQIAIALANAELFAISEAALEAERQSYGELSHEAWLELLRQRHDYRYICDSQGEIHKASLEPATDKEIWSAEEKITWDQGTVVLPIKIRDKTYGGIRLRKSGETRRWSTDELAIVEALTEQLSIALDSARLYETTQRQGQIERMRSEMTDKIHRSFDIDSLMQTLLEEISNALDIDDAFIQLGNPTEIINNGNGDLPS